MVEMTYAWAHLAGRVLFALIFLGSGISHFTQYGMMVGYSTSRGVPLAKVMVPVTGAMSLVGGLSVVLGWHRFIGAGLLVLFMVWTSYFVHHFWTETDPVARMNERVHFMKDVALAGAALFIAYNSGGSWPLSLGG